MSNQTTDEQVVQEVENQYWAELAQALARLEENPDFKRVVLEFMFKERVADINSMWAHDYTVRNNLRPQMMEEFSAIAKVQDIFRVIHAKGTMPEYPDDYYEDEVSEG